MDFTVVVPTYNRKDKLRQCIESLLLQDYPRTQYEIIIVDDGSSDATKGLVESFLNGNSNLRFLSQLHRGPAAARNLGIKEARGKYVGFTDNDCIVDQGWISQMAQAFMVNKNILAVGGLTKIDLSNIKAAVSQCLSDGAILTEINGSPETIFFPTCNVSIKKESLNGGFDESFPLPAGEDLEFFWRLYKAGKRFVYAPAIQIFHNCHPNFCSFLKQAYMYGRGNYLVQYIHQDHPLLHEITTRRGFAFLGSVLLNFLKIPRFSFLSGRRLIRAYNTFNNFERFQIYVYFTLHKVMYIAGVITEHLRVAKKNSTLRLDKEKSGESAILKKPEFIILDVTHRCNLVCAICEIRKDRRIKEFTTQEIKGLISQAIEWGVKEFVLSGGEPLIRDDISEILDYVKENRYHIGVLTNGILLKRAFIERLLPYLISGSLSLSISLDALTPGIHDAIRGAQGCFRKTSQALRILSEYKAQHAAINFNVISIILNENLEELLPLAEFIRALNANSMQFQPLLANNLSMKERAAGSRFWVAQERLEILDLTIDNLVEFKKRHVDFLRNSVRNLNLVKKYFRMQLNTRDIQCYYADKLLLVANNGDVTTCFNCYGNVRSKSLQSIYYSPEASLAREKVALCRNPCLLPCFTDYQT